MNTSSEEFYEFIKNLPLKAFIKFFMQIIPGDQDVVGTVPFKLWPIQEEFCDFLDECIVQNKIPLIPKARQLGISEIYACLIIKCMFSGYKKEFVVISKSEVFAEYFLSDRILPKLENLPQHKGITWPKFEITKTQITVKDNKSWVKSLTSSQTSAASMSVNGIFFDEAGGIDENYGNFKQLFSNAGPALSQRKGSWCGIVGTSFPGSHYNSLVEEAHAGENDEFKVFFFPWNSDPSRDEAWYAKQKKKYKENVFLQYPRTIEDFFYVKEGKIFKSFNPRENENHVQHLDVQRLYNLKFIIGYDHGFVDPACCLFTFYDPYEDILYIVEEYYKQHGHQTEVDNIARDINKLLLRYPKAPTKKIADTNIRNRNIGVRSAEYVFKKAGIKWQMADKSDLLGGIMSVSQRFTHNKIIINSSCHNLIEELRTYRWDTNKKGEVPQDKNNHAIDALRYIDSELSTEKKPTKKQRTKAYSLQSQEMLAQARSAFGGTFPTRFSGNGSREITSFQGY